jgi:hypothetical protein
MDYSPEMIVETYYSKMGLKVEKSCGKLSKIGGMRVEYSCGRISKVGANRIEYSCGKISKIGVERVQYSGSTVKVGATKL